MSSEPTPVEPTPPTKPTPPLAGRIFTSVVRGLLCAGLLLCGWLLLRTYRDLFAEIRPIPPSNPIAFDQAPGFTECLLQQGSWHFTNTSWMLARHDVEAARIEAAFNREVPPRPEGVADEQERAVLKWLQESSKVKPDAGGSIYENARDSLRWRAWTSGTGAAERLRLARVGWQHEPGRWIVFEVRPVVAAQQGTQHLLPAGAPVESLARRWDGDDHLDAELVRMDRDLDAVAEYCRGQRWTTRQLWARSEAGIGWRLTGPDGTLQVWALPDGGPIKNWALVLVDRREPKR
jgi:hypothetical protein